MKTRFMSRFTPSVRPLRRQATLLSALLAGAGLALAGCATGAGGHPEAHSHDGSDEAATTAQTAASTDASPAATEDVAASADVIEASTATIVVSGLSCPMCATNIDQQMGRVEGVKTALVDLSKGHVRLSLHPNARVTRSRLVKAVEDSGFTVREIIAPSPKGSL